jgi:3-oxoacyl-[acyl-carrier protein] reductase
LTPRPARSEPNSEPDIAVSNVGRRLLKPFESISIEDWDWAIRTNLSSCFYLAHHVIPAMRDRM